jgi:hypothetical protein
MFPNMSGNETNIKLPFAFIIYSLIAMVTSQLLLLLNAELISSYTFRAPGIWSAAHLFILGWALMVAMGAMYQLVPVAFLTPIWSEKFGFIQFGVISIGITWFAIVLYTAPNLALYPGLLTLLGIVMFIIQMVMTLKKQAKPNILTAFVGSALFCLLLTILLGITMVISMKTGLFSDSYLAIFQSHLLLGVAGWFTLLIFGFSYKMVPMFSLAHGFPMTLSKYVYYTYVSGLLVSVFGIISNQRILISVGMLLLFSGYSLFCWHVRIIVKKRVKKKLDKPFQFALLAIGFGTLIHLLALIFSFTSAFSFAAGPLLFLYILTWIAFSIIGYLYKIIPFLWWTHKYSKEIGKKAVPSLKEMMNEKIAVPLFGVFAFAALIITIGFLLKNFIVYFAGQLLLMIAAVIFSVAVAGVIRK